ncbi:hypothetical protein Dsin_022713 [Dipteronia sinensis]|uniref:UspA domain-containing protein n=1 Tax=Dipteronia sinensis TaxID=43782 RepID=A0AAE0E026_9ROSI|nr:hypothetical protein Dsin_022713 [Dipteronia sinensis]
MNPHQTPPDPDHPHLPTIKIQHPTNSAASAAASAAATPTPTSLARRRIGVAVDLSDESAFAVCWAVNHYIRPGDAVILIHVSPTSVLFGADWGPLPHRQDSDDAAENNNRQRQQQTEDDFDAFTATKAADLAKPLKDAGFPYKIHIVKDHDMRERLCLEIERLEFERCHHGKQRFWSRKARQRLADLGASVTTVCITVSVRLWWSDIRRTRTEESRWSRSNSMTWRLTTKTKSLEAIDS